MKSLGFQGLTLVGLFVLGFLLVSEVRKMPKPGLKALANTEREFVLVLLVSPECGASRHPTLPSAWKDMVEHLQSITSDSVSLRLVGVSMSMSVDPGTDLLESFGEFHEVSIGGGLRNAGALRYMLTDFPGPSEIPQIVLIDREFSEGPVDGRPTLVYERVVLRLWGVSEIVQGKDRMVRAVLNEVAQETLGTGAAANSSN
jgi:hypothetical protein